MKLEGKWGREEGEGMEETYRKKGREERERRREKGTMDENKREK